METTDLVPLIEQLDDNIDDLEEALGSLLQGSLSKTAGKLPLLDKAHLYVLVTYAIESILFSYLRLNGVDSKEHPVFRELTRVKQYFEKIKTAESAGMGPRTKLDRAAASRFIKHALAGNVNHDANVLQHQVVKKAATHTRFDELSQKHKADDGKDAESRDASSDGKTCLGTLTSVIDKPSPENGTEEIQSKRANLVLTAQKAERKKRKSQSDGPRVISNTNAPENEQQHVQKKMKKERKKQRALENH